MDNYPLKISGRQNDLPEAKYTRFGEKIRQAIPGPMQCSMACGGRNCKWENPARWSDEDQAIKGVFSSWVWKDIIAMSRPSTEVIKKYDLIKQFKTNNITSIINLQRPGEHASCGPPLHKESQFTYLPQTFMDNDIFFYNFGWKDYGVASLDTILDMVKVMAFALSEGKVAVHCHAGLGRTGVLIACYLVFAERMDASSAIKTVRQRRANSVQTRGQIACIQEFAQFLRPLRIVFPQVAPHAERLTLKQFLYRQRHLLHGFESRELRYIPKIVHVVCQRLIVIATTSESNLFDYRKRANTGPKLKSAKKRAQLRRSNTVATIKESLPGAFLNERIELFEDQSEAVSSQEVDALLSPRLSRRGDSAGSKTSTSPKSKSGPSSPTLKSRKTILPENGDFPGENEPPTDPTEEGAGAVDDPGFVGPQVVLVKQGSRSALLPVATNLTQVQTDINENNNNQILESNSLKLNTNTNSSDVSPQPSPPSPLGSNMIIESKTQNVSPPPKYPLPSPTPSIHEPHRNIEPRKSAMTDKVQRSAEVKPVTQNYRSSAGRAQRVVPTGVPLRNRAGSGKGRKIELFADEPDDIISSDDIMPNQDEEEENPPQNEEELELVGEDESSQDKNEGKIEDEDTETESAGDFSEVEDLDKELDEIIEISQEDGPFLSESDNEGQEDLGKSGEVSLSHSMTSRVSWTEQLKSGDKSNDHDLNATSQEEHQEEKGSRSEDIVEDTSPLRSDQVDADESAPVSDKSISPSEALNEDGAPETIGPGQSSPEIKSTTQTAESDTEDVYKLQKPLGLPLRSLTRSLGDLRNYEGEEIMVSMSDLTDDPSVPASPVSKSNSSDDVRTPIGSASKKRIKDPITVAMALAYKLTDNEWLWEKVYSKQVELNTREGAWSGFDQEADAHLLTCLMWSWIEHLSKPILCAEDVDTLIQLSRPGTESSSAMECPDPALFEEGLSALDKNICSTFHCILRCLLSLPPLSFELETSVIRRVISALTQIHISEFDNEENADQQKRLQDLESIIRNYLVKTRVKERKIKKMSFDSTSNEKDAAASSNGEFHSDVKDSEIPQENNLNEENVEGPATEEIIYKDESESSSQASSVSELPPRITVS